MANLSEIIVLKNHNDEQWKAQKQAERENAAAMQDAGMEEISSNPDAYARYLEIQGDNPLYSAGNIALAMVQNPNITQFGTVERWKTLGRSVPEGERGKGVQIFSRASFGKGYSLVSAYDISQTTGREIKKPVLQDGSLAMESALSTLLNYSIVPVVVDTEMDVPAFYDEGKLELAISPNYPDGEAFGAIATEVAHSRFHAKGANTHYNRSESELDAQSVSYILCKRFGVKRDLPDLSALPQLYSGWTPQEVRQALDIVQTMSKKMVSSIEQSIAPQQHTRGQAKRPVR